MSKVLTDNKHYTDIAAAIREKNGTDDKYKPAEMADAIAAIETGGGDLPEEAFNITGDCNYRFSGNGWNWFLINYGNRIQTKDITSLENMFSNNTNIENIPFEINFNILYTTPKSLINMFRNCMRLKSIPKINNCIVSRFDKVFQSCCSIRYFPDDIADWFDWSYIEEGISSSYSGNMDGIFNGCYSLRKLPISIIEHTNPRLSNSYCVYNNLLPHCCSLDEITNIPVHYQEYTLDSNGFNNTFFYTGRLKELVFKTNEDGTAIKAKWKSQTITLSTQVGYYTTKSDILNYNSGITADKEVKDDATYQALKNDADWFSTKSEYSRYNRTSAVNTIN